MPTLSDLEKSIRLQLAFSDKGIPPISEAYTQHSADRHSCLALEQGIAKQMRLFEEQEIPTLIQETGMVRAMDVKLTVEKPIDFLRWVDKIRYFPEKNGKVIYVSTTRDDSKLVLKAESFDYRLLEFAHAFIPWATLGKVRVPKIRKLRRSELLALFNLRDQYFSGEAKKALIDNFLEGLSNDKISQQAIKALTNTFRKNLPDISWPDIRRQLETIIDSSDSFVYAMEFIPEPTAEGLLKQANGPQNVLKFIMKPKNQYVLGRLHAADLFLGNNDRLFHNLGNWIPPSSANPKLLALDNVSPTGPAKHFFHCRIEEDAYNEMLRENFFRLANQRTLNRAAQKAILSIPHSLKQIPGYEKLKKDNDSEQREQRIDEPLGPPFLIKPKGYKEFAKGLQEGADFIKEHALVAPELWKWSIPIKALLGRLRTFRTSSPTEVSS